MFSLQQRQSAPAKDKDKDNSSQRTSALPQTESAARSLETLPLSLRQQPVLYLSANQIAPSASNSHSGLIVNQPGDRYEQEADSVADRVMRMPESSPRRSACACGGGCPRCQNGNAAHTRLQTKRVHAPDTGESVAPPIVQELLHSSGQPLDTSTREFMEPRFGQDFSRVRIHADGNAERAAHAVEARAYTVGRDIVFGKGEYAPATNEGKRLIAHELTHVVQQRGQDSPVKRRIQRAPRTLPARVGQSNFMLTGGGSQASARTTIFGQGYRPSGDVSAIVGEGMTLRGLARMLLPLYDRAATAPGASHAPTEDELAKAILEYDRVQLGVRLVPPQMSNFRAGLRLPLPVQLDVNPGPVSNARNDWLLDPDNVRTRAAIVTPVEAALVDSPAAAAAAPPAAADVTAFTASVSGANSQGMALWTRVMTNPFDGAPLAAMVLTGMNAGDRFEAAMGFMSMVTNPDVTMLESLAPGFTLLQTLRAALSAPPVGLLPARDATRLADIGKLPADPAIAGLNSDVLVSAQPGGGLDRPDIIFFRRGRSSIDASESAKFASMRAANPGPVTLIGSTSEEEDPALATARLRIVENNLRLGSAVVDTLRAAATSTGSRPSVGSLAYAQMRSVRIDPAPPPFEPDCHTVTSTSEACLPNHANVDTRFKAAHSRALDIMTQAITRLSAGSDPGRDAAMRRRFGVVSLANTLKRINMLNDTIKASLTSFECGTTCDAACNSGAIAYSRGPGASPLMVICEGVLSNDLEYAASVIIHESSHATQGMRQASKTAPGHPADWAYRWERMSGTITEMSPSPKISNAGLDNADSYTQFVMDLRDPALIPAGSQPIDEAPSDDFQGTWNPVHRTRVRHGLALSQKWLIWGGQYLANSYDDARQGAADNTYGFVKTRFGGFPAIPGDLERSRLAGLQYNVRLLTSRMRLAMRIEHAAPGDPTSFGAASPLLLLVGDDATSLASDRARGELFVRKLIDGAPEVDSAQRAAYAGLVLDIRTQYEADH